MSLYKLRNVAYVIYILSLIPGDTFYGDLGLAQSHFLIPVVLLYFIKPRLKFNGTAIYPILFIIVVATFYLFLDFKGAVIEWYRIIGNIFLLIMLPDMYAGRSRSFLVFPMILIGVIPCIAFYLGFWELKLEYQLRMSFLRHDPNILSYNLLYGYIFTLYYLRFKQTSWIKKYLALLIISIFFLIPILATISRTAMIVFILVFIFYLFLAEQKSHFRWIALGIVITLSIVAIGIAANNELVLAVAERVNETDDTRTGFIEAAFTVIQANFFTGVGLSNFGNEQWRISKGFLMVSDGAIVQTASHNGMLDIMMIGGIFFFLAFIYVLIYPSVFINNRKKMATTEEYCMDRFLAISVFITFIIINLTYSSYMSKTAWTSVTILYIVIKNYFKNKLSTGINENKVDIGYQGA